MPPTNRKIAVCMPHRGIGDLIWHLPFIREIANFHGGCQIDLITRASTHAADLFANESCLRQIIYQPYLHGFAKHPRELWNAVRLFRQESYDTVWILDKISRLATAAALAGVPNRFGFGYGKQNRWLSRSPNLPPEMRKRHQIHQLESFFDAMGLPVPSAEPRLKLDPAALQTAERDMAGAPRPWICMSLSASTEERNPPMAFYQHVVQAIEDEIGGTIFIVGGPADKDAGSKLNASSSGRIRIRAGHSVSEMAAVLSLSDLFLGPDSGPLNIAAAVATPSIGMFGPTEPLFHSKFIHPVQPSDGGQDLSTLAPSEIGNEIARILSPSPDTPR